MRSKKIFLELWLSSPYREDMRTLSRLQPYTKGWLPRVHMRTQDYTPTQGVTAKGAVCIHMETHLGFSWITFRSVRDTFRCTGGMEDVSSEISTLLTTTSNGPHFLIKCLVTIEQTCGRISHQWLPLRRSMGGIHIKSNTGWVDGLTRPPVPRIPRGSLR